MAEKASDWPFRLAQEIRNLITLDIAGPYSALSPRGNSDGTYTMLVKDNRHKGVLELVIREKATS